MKAKLLGFIFAILLLSFRLTQTPSGLTVDEASFGYNGVLLAKTLHDENGKFLPLFVLSINGHDWRQPITQYFVALFFKIFPANSFTLRLTSVLVAVLSMSLIYLLARKLLSQKAAIFAAILFVMTPIIFIQSHLALDNITPVPFMILWLLFLYRSQGQKNLGSIFLSGAFLGIGLYSYKAMRIIVPPLSAATLFYFLYLEKWKFREIIRPSLAYLTGVVPFFAIMPLLRVWYPGAISGGYQFHLMAWDNFLFPVISTFDPSFLFIKGDSTVYHSTGIHGMFLLAGLPLFLVGVYQSIKKGGFWILLTISFFAVPVLFGLIDSYYRASRLLAMVPMFTLVSALGFEFLLKGKRFSRILLCSILFLLFLNFADFAKYYWFLYPKRYISDFGQIKDNDYKALAIYSKENRLDPYIEKGVYDSDGEVAHFLEAAFFNNKIKYWSDTMQFPDGGVLLTYRDKVEGARLVEKLPNYNLYVKN